MLNPSKEEIKKLLDSLKDISGISYDERKVEEIYHRKIKDLIKVYRYSSFNKLLLDVIFKRNKKLIEELVNKLTINETYFFRESYQFETLIKFAIPERIKKTGGSETIRILSAPCSTGEEIYSIMIYLLEEGNFIKNYNFMILGIDIDTKVIEKAKKGIFSQRSVHKLSSRLIAKYFQKLDNGNYQINKSLRVAANFKVVNVLDEKEMSRLGLFDVIFSRNMLIYFDKETKVKVVDTFSKILKPGGFLFLGHAEKVEKSKSLKPVKFEETYFYQKV